MATKALLRAVVKDNNGETVFDYQDTDSAIWWHFLTQCNHYNYHLQVYDLKGNKVYHSERDNYKLPYQVKDKKICSSETNYFFVPSSAVQYISDQAQKNTDS